MPDAADSSPPDSSDPGGAGKAAFLGGLLVFVCLVALSILGLGHARSIEGAANAQFWVVVTGVAGALGFVALSLARTRARTARGDMARRAGVALAVLWLGVFVWEAVAVGSGAFAGPFELGWAIWKN